MTGNCGDEGLRPRIKISKTKHLVLAALSHLILPSPRTANLYAKREGICLALNMAFSQGKTLMAEEVKDTEKRSYGRSNKICFPFTLAKEMTCLKSILIRNVHSRDKTCPF